MTDRMKCICGGCKDTQVLNLAPPGSVPKEKVLVPTGGFDAQARPVYEPLYVVEGELEKGSYISCPIGWPPCQILSEAKLVRNSLEWHKLSEGGRSWWLAFEEKYKDRPQIVLRLLEEIQIRWATIEEYFLAYLFDNSNNVQTGLDFLDSVISKGRKGRRLLREEFETALI